MQPTAVTAMTLTCAAGTGLAEVGSALKRGCSGLRENDFPHCGLSTWIGRVDGVEAIEMPARLADRHCRNNQLALLGLEQDGFVEAVARATAAYGAHRVACILGTSTGGIGAAEDAYRAGTGRLPNEYRLPRVHTPHTTSAFVADLLGLAGPVSTISTACSSSAKVFAAAERMMRLGLIDAAVVGGVDSLCLSVLYGFHALELVSPGPCRPFDRRRDGLNLGEAAGFVLLERTSDKASAMLAGAGESSDAHHMSAPHPEGAGALAAMRQALNSAGLEAGDVGYINLHGTATQLNDAAEARAVEEVFGVRVPASSTKGWTGHALGAAGVTEAVISLLALDSGFLPGTLNCEAPDIAGGAFVMTDPRNCPVDTVMTNSFGFGGSNCALLFARP